MTKRKLLFTSVSSLVLVVIGLFFLTATDLPAQSVPIPVNLTGSPNIQLPPLIVQMVTLVGLALLPYFLMLLTSFIKIVVVLSLLRSALGVQQAPPNQVINGIALILSIYVMFPTGYAIYNNAKQIINDKMTQELFSKESAEFILQVAEKSKEPLREFLVKNTRAKHERSFYRLAHRFFPEEVRSSIGPNDFIVMIPAYITSQLEDAFQIGVLIYLPFFVIDLVTSNVLLAMGMMMLSPMTIALPLKLLLLVMIDGWSLLVNGLVMSFTP